MTDTSSRRMCTSNEREREREGGERIMESCVCTSEWTRMNFVDRNTILSPRISWKWFEMRLTQYLLPIFPLYPIKLAFINDGSATCARLDQRPAVNHNRNRCCCCFVQNYVSLLRRKLKIRR